jgi:hypothetical protein
VQSGNWQGMRYGSNGRGLGVRSVRVIRVMAVLGAFVDYVDILYKYGSIHN